jgi:hypothetical protein
LRPSPGYEQHRSQQEKYDAPAYCYGFSCHGFPPFVFGFNASIRVSLARKNFITVHFHDDMLLLYLQGVLRGF